MGVILDFFLNNSDLFLVGVYGIQISIIILLFFLTHELTKHDSKRYTVLLKYGWLLNLFIVIIAIYSLRENVTSANNPFLFLSSDILNFLMSYVFCALGLYSFGFHKYLREKFAVSFTVYLISLIIAYAIIFLFHRFYSENVFFELFFNLLNAVSVGVLAAYYYNQCASKSARLMILLGLGLYASLQFLTMFSIDWFGEINEIIYKELLKMSGWSLSALAKSLLAIGLYRAIIFKVNERLKIEVYEKILSLSLHESFSQIKYAYQELEYEIIPGLSKQDSTKNFSRSVLLRKLESVVLAIRRIEYIHDATDKLFVGAHSIEKIENIKLGKLLDDGNDEPENLKVNNIIEYCYLWRKRDKGLGAYNLQCHYGGNCIVFFSEEALQQVIINALKNSEEAYEKLNSSAIRIFVKTSVLKEVGQCLDTENKEILEDLAQGRTFVKLEIEDDGVGTNMRLEEMIEYGVSEKIDQFNDNKNMGIGMWVIYTFMRSYGGHVAFESPPTNSMINKDIKKNKGSKLTLYIPRPKT